MRNSKGIPSETEVDLTLKTNMEPQDILMLADFLNEVTNIQKPAKRYYEQFIKELNEDGFFVDTLTINHIQSIFDKLKQLVDDHNLYFNSLSNYRLTKVVNNSTMHNTYQISIDTVNLIQAQTSVDATTGPLKDKANTSEEAKAANFRTSGNAINKFESINENQVGRKGIGICATGLKSYFALTQYCNWALNYGTPKEQERILLGPDHKGVQIGGKTYKILANIRAIDLNTVRNSETFKALSEVTQDEDIALTLSALLSLATDNAKELALSKLNAGIKMLGMYVYGLSIGMKFDDIADILMSPVGNVIKSLLDQDKFANKDGFKSVSEGLFKYFEKGPHKQLSTYHMVFDSNGDRLAQNPYIALENEISAKFSLQVNKKAMPLQDALVEIAKNQTQSLWEKINIIESLRKAYKGKLSAENKNSNEAREKYNQLIDFVEDYIQQADVIWRHESLFNDIKTLSEGASELKTLGQVLGVNQGIKTSTDEFLTQINNLRRAIYNKTKDPKDIIDLTQFAFNQEYRENVINKYESYKHSFNIFDCVSKVPHFMGYLQELATAHVEVNNAFTFRSSDNLLLEVKQQLGEYVDENKLARGLQNYCGDYLLRHWMLDSQITIIVPKGNQAFDKSGNLYPLTEDKVLHLGLAEDNATFRLWIENEVIPNLKKGIIQPGIHWPKISGNKFIQDLGYNLVNKTVSRNSTIIQALPINMLPNIDIERNLFNQYKSQFNALTDSYVYELTRNVTKENGSVESEKYLSEPIAINDLFILYSMITNNWKLDQSSLVPITEDFQNVGLIKSFHDYVTEMDKSGFTLSMGNTIWRELLPYVAPSDSPYTSSSQIIWAKNPHTMKRQLMSLVNYNDDYEEEISSRIGKYSPMNSVENINYFGTTQITDSSAITSVTVGDTNYDIQYDLITHEYKAFDSKVNEELHKEFSTLPMVKADKIVIPDTRLASYIENIVNKCN